jgi:hypothetical protein
LTYPPPYLHNGIKEYKMKKIATIAVKGENGGELNLVSWNGKPPKIDVSRCNEKEGGGFTFSSEEGLRLTKSLAEYLARDSSSILHNDSIKNADKKNKKNKKKKKNMLKTEDPFRHLRERLEAERKREDLKKYGEMIKE